MQEGVQNTPEILFLSERKSMISDALIKGMENEKFRVFQVTTNIDLILLDYEMPVVKGPQVLEMIRSESNTKGIPVMFLTSKNDKESIMQVMDLNPTNYLLKSLPQDTIARKIRDFFEEEA